jgi:hypothetical protein
VLGHIIAFALSVAASAQCPLERAHYALRHKANVTMDFEDVPTSRDWEAGISLHLTSGEHHRSYWFLPYSGNGQGIANHLSSADPPGGNNWKFPSSNWLRGHPLSFDLDYVAADASYNFDQDFSFAKNAPAPAHIFVPNLQTEFWYDRADSGVAEGMPYAFFDLVSCR